MSKEWKAKKATQARLRRAKQKQRLETLKQQATADGATKKLKTEYLAALNKRKALLKGNLKRIAKHRMKLKTDKQKAEKVK